MVFFFSLRASNLKKHPEAADLADLGNLLCQGVECFQPSGTVEGKDEVLKALRCYGDTNVQVELVSFTPSGTSASASETFLFFSDFFVPFLFLARCTIAWTRRLPRPSPST